MGILNMIGLVTAEEHAKVKKEQVAAVAEADKAAGIITRQTATIATLQHNADLDRAAIEKQAAKIDELTRQLTNFRAKRDRDNAGRAARHARDAAKKA